MTEDIVIGWREQLSTETRPWSVDMLPAMDTGDLLGDATASLTDLLDGSDTPTGLVGTPVVATTFITQSVTGLTAGHNYKLELLANMGASKHTAVVLLLRVPY